MESFNNAVDGEEYGKIKRDFESMKERNKRMEEKMEELVKEIEGLKGGRDEGGSKKGMKNM